MASRGIVRDLDEDARDVARATMKTKAFPQGLAGALPAG